MRALILAAGEGRRLRPLTEKTPKPLTPINGIPIIEWHIRRLTAAGFTPLIINLFHLGEQIAATLGDGSRLGAQLLYSREATLLGTAGGIRQAIAKGWLPDPFLLVNSDTLCDNDLSRLQTVNTDSAHLLLIDNPPHNPYGDFSLIDGQLRHRGESPLTYAGQGVFSPDLFTSLPLGENRPLQPLIAKAIDNHAPTGHKHTGHWHDIGTPERLAAARENFRF